MCDASFTGVSLPVFLGLLRGALLGGAIYECSDYRLLVARDPT
jgi:hypothetical protein